MGLCNAFRRWPEGQDEDHSRRFVQPKFPCRNGNRSIEATLKLSLVNLRRKWSVNINPPMSRVSETWQW